MAYNNLLSAGTINALTLPNRIVLSAMGSHYCESDGYCNERTKVYYESMAKGGTGLIILETSAAAWPSGASTPYTLGFSQDQFIPDLADLVSRVHKHGARIAAQINHAGKSSTFDIAEGRPVYVPSKPRRMKGNLMKALTRDEMMTFVSAAGPDGKGPRYKAMDQDDINQMVQTFSEAAGRAKQAGFDAIEIHAGHGYVLSSFLSPYANQREDNYGGSAENRARLLCEIVQSIRQTVGESFPIIVRLDANEYRIEGGTTIEDAVEHARLVEKAGADAIDVSAYGNGLSGIAFTEAPLVHKPAGLLDFARVIKKAVSVPVIAVGRITPEVADKEIGEGNIDFLAMGRKLLADPELPIKLRSAPSSIRPCIYCYVCVSSIFLNKAMRCAVNPGIGRETTHDDFSKTTAPKRITIVGGGPSGMEAARVLALRGHTVTLHEKDKQLGGTARIAALPYASNGDLVQWLVHSLGELPVNVKLNSTVSADVLAKEQPDHIVLAVGATRNAPPIRGKELSHVFDGDRLRDVLLGQSSGAMAGLSLWQRSLINAGKLSGITSSIDTLRRMSKFWMPFGKRIVLIGGGLVGLELAEFFAERKREVTVLEPSPYLGQELSVVRRARLLHMLRAANVKLVADSNITQITQDSVRYIKGDTTHEIETDSVIISLGAATNNDLEVKLEGLKTPVSSIGDGSEVGYIEGAMLTARTLAVEL